MAKNCRELQREAEQSEVKHCSSLQPQKPCFLPINAIWASPSLAGVTGTLCWHGLGTWLFVSLLRRALGGC